MGWTKAQEQAIVTPGNLLVSAAAGAGKTAVLTERIARLVAEGTDIKSILVVTFTEAAAGEMKARIEARLYQAAKEAEEAGNAASGSRLRAQAQALSTANISTIHAFCLYVLHRYFYEAGLDPAFSTADDVTGKLLLQQAAEDCAAVCYETGDAGFLALLRALGGEESCLACIRDIYEFLRGQPWPFQWLEQAAAAYGENAQELATHPAITEVLRELKRQTQAAVSQLTQARALLIGCPTVQANLDVTLLSLRALLLLNDANDYRQALQRVDWPRLNWPKAEPCADSETVKALRNSAKDAVKAQAELLSRSIAEEAALMQTLLPVMDALCTFLKNMDARYTAEKRSRSLVDFSDMEHLCLEVLQQEPVRNAVRQRFTHIFVDEYQDSSRIQEAIINAVRREDTLFLVGDVKQSIYRFRQADPSLFLNKLDTYAPYPGAPGAPGIQLHLNANFRSAPQVIQAVNAVFSAIMHRETAELDYDENAALHLPPEAAPCNDPLAGCELHLIDRAAEDDEETMEAAEAEALFAAATIRRLMEEEHLTDPKTGDTRPLRYGDFAVLLRSHRQAAEVWAATLSAQGIPAYAQLTGGYFDAMEVQVFLNLLRVIDNRRQDIPLLSVLLSPVGGFTLEELASLRTDYRAASYFESLQLLAASNNASADAARRFLERLNGWRRDARLLSPEELIGTLLDDTGFYDCVGALPGGAQRQANLDALLSRARANSAEGGLSGFLRFMDHAKNNANLGRAQAGAADVVRILSMHGSKGLEYPVVFAAGLGKRFNAADKRATVVLDDRLGIGLRCIGKDKIRHDTLLRRAIAARAWQQQVAEEMRILYVGMTRAKTRLVLIGSKKNTAEAVEAASASPITLADIAGASCFLDWLLPSFLQCEEGAGTVVCHSQQEVRALARPEAAAPAPAEDNALTEALRARFSWRYPFGRAVTVPSKVSVSQLIQGEERGFDVPVPSFAKNDVPELRAAALGTAIHGLLAGLSLNHCPDTDVPAFLQQEAARLAADNRFPADCLPSLDVSGIAAFLQSPLGRRLRAAKRVERELEFAVEQSADTLLGEGCNEPVLLQGVIDCCFTESNGWVLLDFKTDRLFNGQPAREVAEKHRAQLALYASALETLSGMPVLEQYIVMLSACENVRMA